VARKYKIPLEIMKEGFFSCLDGNGIDLVCLAGFLKKLDVPKEYENRIMNVHPSLLPAFAGLYGRNVHEAVLRRGCKVSGCTIHFVDNVYDNGPIIAQKVVEVENDTTDVLAEKVFSAECVLYPKVIRLFSEGRISVSENLVSLR
jgi:phosphoribosylglycinamide formyltransferase-1